jgi:GntR family transcriptional regulator
MTIPAHQQIREALVSEIEAGLLDGGARLPGENQLATRFGVTRMTVRQALTGMVNDGMLVRRQGAGTFVVENAAKRRNMTRLTSFAEDMAEAGPITTEVLSRQIVPAPVRVAKGLEVAEGEHVTHYARLRSADGQPMTVQYSWVRLDAFPDLWTVPLIDGSLYATLREQGVELRSAEQRVAAEPATEERARLLGIPEGTPVLRVERVARDGRNLPVEFARSWMRPGVEITTHIER